MSCGAYVDIDSPYMERIGLRPADARAVSGYLVAASRAIDKYCSRSFLTATYDETYRPSADSSLLLNQYPVQTITRVFDRQQQALQLRNTSGAVSNASYAIAENGLRLNHVASGNATTTLLTFEANPTLAEMAEAVNEIGTGWQATAVAQYSGHASSDLESTQFGNAKSAGDLLLWIEAENYYFSLDKEIGRVEGPFFRGQPVRFNYLAGYDLEDVPEEIKVVTTEITRQLYSGATIATSRNLGMYSYGIAQETADQIVLSYKQILNLYRDRRLS